MTLPTPPPDLEPPTDDDQDAIAGGQDGLAGAPDVATEADVGPGTATDPATPHVVHDHRWAWALITVFVLALGFGLWGIWTLVTPRPDTPQATQRVQRVGMETLEQRVATLTRSDQISRDANRDLQGTLAERDEEIAGLRADVAFYERFVGATGQRRGLSVHELQLQARNGQAWPFTATLTQNVNRGAVNSGKLTMSVEGTRDGKRERLDWSTLRQEANAAGTPYSFKYFQQVEGDLLLPAGFSPLRITVRLVPNGGAAVEQSFTWADAARGAAGSP